MNPIGIIITVVVLLILSMGAYYLYTTYIPKQAPPVLETIPSVPNTGATCRSDIDNGLCTSMSSNYCKAIMQNDGNFTIYNNTTPIWTSNTSGAGKRLIMQNDGNLVIYNPDNGVPWATTTFGIHPPYRAVMQNDCNFAIYDANNAILWQTNTAGSRK